MNVYKMDNEKLQKVSSDFNNTMYGRRIWLFSRTPEVVGFIALLVYFILTLYGASHAELKETITYFVIADIIVLGLSLILYGFAEVTYWRQVAKFANSQDSSKKEETKTKTLVVQEAKTVEKKAESKPAKKTESKKKTTTKKTTTKSAKKN